MKKIENRFSRNDYKEVIEFVMIFFGTLPPRSIHFRQIRAHHLAQLMSKEICCLKMLLFYQQFKLSVLEKGV